ncbi:unnamed protein product [Protopolystoma xenopodis]|uniref:Uncharacterized protein n=1 Tax=Protopolystoma xenopodis TaxID=117903 RepID=A0A448WEZ1_9PLAT|nr:unnamed protein product [Protopolystoma xenopodis]
MIYPNELTLNFCLLPTAYCIVLCTVTHQVHTKPHPIDANANAKEDLASSDTQRIEAARNLFLRLVNSNKIGYLSRLLQQMQTLCRAYVEFANADVERYRGQTGDIPLPATSSLRRLVSPSSITEISGSTIGFSDAFSLVAVPTCPPFVDHSGRYAGSIFDSDLRDAERIRPVSVLR